MVLEENEGNAGARADEGQWEEVVDVRYARTRAAAAILMLDLRGIPEE